MPIGNDFKSSSQNGRRFHLHLRFVPIREIVPVRRKSMFTYVCLILSFHFIKELKWTFRFVKETKKDCVLYIRKKLKKKNVKLCRLICNLIVSEQVRASVFAFLFYKRNKKLVPRALLSYISSWEFSRTPEKCEKHSPAVRASLALLSCS